MKYYFEDQIYSLFDNVKLEKTEEKKPGEIINERYNLKYKYPNVKECSFTVTPEKFKKEIIEFFNKNADMLSGNVNNFNVVLKVLNVLFSRVNDNIEMKGKEDREFKYFNALSEAVMEICERVENKFPVILFNMLFLSTINRMFFISRNYFSVYEIKNIYKRIDYWSKITKYIDIVDIKEMLPEYCIYWDLKEAALSLFNYLCILSEKKSEQEKYKGLFNTGISKLYFGYDLDFYKSPVRMRKIKPSVISSDILKSRIGKKGVEDLILCQENNTKLKADFLNAYVKCFNEEEIKGFLMDLIFDNLYFSKKADLTFILKNGFNKIAKKINKNEYLKYIHEKNIKINNCFYEKGNILYKVKDETIEQKFSYIFDNMKG